MIEAVEELVQARSPLSRHVRRLAVAALAAMAAGVDPEPPLAEIEAVMRAVGRGDPVELGALNAVAEAAEVLSGAP